MIETRYRDCTNSLTHNLRSLCTGIPKRQLLNDAADSLENLEAERDALRVKLELSMQAVQFYASQTSYSSSWVISDRTPIHAMEDKGRVAKNALAAIERLEGKG